MIRIRSARKKEPALFSFAGASLVSGPSNFYTQFGMAPFDNEDHVAESMRLCYGHITQVTITPLCSVIKSRHRTHWKKYLKTSRHFATNCATLPDAVRRSHKKVLTGSHDYIELVWQRSTAEWSQVGGCAKPVNRVGPRASQRPPTHKTSVKKTLFKSWKKMNWACRQISITSSAHMGGSRNGSVSKRVRGRIIAIQKDLFKHWAKKEAV